MDRKMMNNDKDYFGGFSSVFTLSDAQFDFEVDRRGHHRLGEDQDVLQTDHHHQVRKDLSAEENRSHLITQ